MNDDVELTPLTAGAVTVQKNEREKLEFPVGQMIQVHVTDGKFGKFKKEVEDRDTGEAKTIEQTKVIYTFQVDSEVKDLKGVSLKGKSFSKGITLSAHERATYPQFISAVTGSYNADPSVALGKPLQVLFQPTTEFNGNEYQPITYLPPADGQKAPAKDVVPEDVLSADEVSKFFEPQGDR